MWNAHSVENLAQSSTGHLALGAGGLGFLGLGRVLSRTIRLHTILGHELRPTVGWSGCCRDRLGMGGPELESTFWKKGNPAVSYAIEAKYPIVQGAMCGF